jgi:uncharacterized protein (TIRG00374 family)
MVISTVLGVALVATLVGVADLGKVMAVVRQLNLLSVLGFGLLMVVYESVRGVQWHALLKGLGVRVSLRAEVFSYLWGEATKAAPAGNYFQNYLLGRIEGEDFSKTSAATTLVVLIEIVCGLLMVAVIQIDGWTWLRPLVLIGLSVVLLVVGGGLKLVQHSGLSDRIARHGRTSSVFGALDHFREGVAALAKPYLLIRQACVSATYIGIAGVALFVLAVGLGVNQLSLPQSLGIYAFTMVVGLLMPLPVDFGVIEISGVGALLAMGVNREVAVALMLMNRILNLGSAIAIAAVGTVFLRDELHRVVSPRKQESHA